MRTWEPGSLQCWLQCSREPLTECALCSLSLQLYSRITWAGSRRCIMQTDCLSTSRSEPSLSDLFKCVHSQHHACSTIRWHNQVARQITLYKMFLCCSKDGGRCEIYLKREDLNHTGAHKINNSLGQVLLCRRMGKKRVIAETGAGQHGVATVSMPLAAPLICKVLEFGL